jgi:hypothetical protein
MKTLISRCNFLKLGGVATLGLAFKLPPADVDPPSLGLGRVMNKLRRRNKPSVCGTALGWPISTGRVRRSRHPEGGTTTTAARAAVPCEPHTRECQIVIALDVARGAPGLDAIYSGWRHLVADELHSAMGWLTGHHRDRKAHTEHLTRQVLDVARLDPGCQVLVAFNVNYCHHIRHALRRHPEVQVVSYKEL